MFLIVLVNNKCFKSRRSYNLESTVPIGTTNFIKSIIDKKHKKLKNKYYLSYCQKEFYR